MQPRRIERCQRRKHHTKPNPATNFAEHDDLALRGTAADHLGAVRSLQLHDCLTDFARRRIEPRRKIVNGSK